MKAKKSLGQNFLHDEEALAKIILAADLRVGEQALEIGPGRGALTEKLLENKAKVLAIEKDRDLIPFLKQKFSKAIADSKLTLQEGDILQIDLEKLLEKNFPNENYKLVANIPYYITGAILEKFFTSKNKPEKMVLLVQKEVAERIIAQDKKESILSLSVSLYGSARIVSVVDKTSFTPSPKVDSAILEINLNHQLLDSDLETKYFQVLHSAFAHKRKKLIKNLELTFPKINWRQIFTKLNLQEDIRAEKLDKDTFLELAKLVDKY